MKKRSIKCLTLSNSMRILLLRLKKTNGSTRGNKQNDTTIHRKPRNI